MAILPSPSPPSSPSRSMRRRGFFRRCERYCCTAVTYFPLAFVYGLTSWAVWVEVGIGFLPTSHCWTGKGTSALGFILYLLLNWSYTTAVFTDPGSPLNTKNGYSHLPTTEGREYTSFTVKSSTGDLRFCKKCQTKKPDRAHHCSTCKRCVLKMDHHCPWLATCVGLHNYKAFLLFLIYLTFFCWVCFATTATWVWKEMLSEGQYAESFMPVNYVLLAVLSGIIGLVITGFTAWHLWLTSRGQTTIESLEKTRYLSPLRNSMRNQLNNRNYVEAQAEGRLSIGDQLREIHANALPGVTRPEEGESSPSRSDSRSPGPGYDSGSSAYSPSTYQHRAHQRDFDRYDDYLDERDNELMPNAFDHGWRSNFTHVFGPSPLLWPFPICNTTGDGWVWEASSHWREAHERIQRERAAEAQRQRQRERAAGWGIDSPTETEFFPQGRAPEGYQSKKPATVPSYGHYGQARMQKWEAQKSQGGGSRFLSTFNGPSEERRSPGKADQILGRERGMYTDGAMQLQTLDRRRLDPYYISSDDEDDASGGREQVEANPTPSSAGAPPKATQNWNDVPEDFLKPPPKEKARSSKENSENRRKRREEWDDWGTEG
ncbi:zf-DHHC-domain-containing protein [Delitschia confertaspora ATCC 74209]|uniref:Palmitoyltransferase n=1 Tax=Delitschia confertaspora ATCC 74209 TaxID=1513339 RepID=A0A9P4JPP7_9PLEO|nr:zf-DHHC-domain-containing protein [Delitschia confertaspora ATCC 74209]